MRVLAESASPPKTKSATAPSTTVGKVNVSPAATPLPSHAASASVAGKTTNHHTVGARHERGRGVVGSAVGAGKPPSHNGRSGIARSASDGVKDAPPAQTGTATTTAHVAMPADTTAMVQLRSVEDATLQLEHTIFLAATGLARWRCSRPGSLRETGGRSSMRPVTETK